MIARRRTKRLSPRKPSCRKLIGRRQRVEARVLDREVVATMAAGFRLTRAGYFLDRAAREDREEPSSSHVHASGPP